MKKILGNPLAAGVAVATAMLGMCAPGQTHKVSKPETVVRAVAVYEWTGDLAKPTASRLIPVTLFIDGRLEDAGVYLARPVPFALLTGNYYELQQAGMAKGGLELAFARHVQTDDAMFDDGWFGYGKFRSLPAAKKAPVLVASRTLPVLKSSSDDGKPHFAGQQPAGGGGAGSSGSGSGSSGTASSGGSTDSDRPTLHRKTDSGADSTASQSSGTTASSSGSGSSAQANDPDRPALHRKAGSDSDSGTSSAGRNTGSVPDDDPDRPHFSKRHADDASGTDTASDAGAGTTTASNGTSGSGSGSSGSSVPSGGSKDDPDRPTLKRRSADDIKRDRAMANSSSVTEAGSFENDPDRPVLRYGKPANAMNETDLPKLVGMPVDTKQMVAVSDAANREPHDFARPWDDDAERTAILTKMEALARAKLTAYTATAAAAAAAVQAAKAPAPSTAGGRRAVAAKKKAEAEPAPVVPLLDEELKGYTLSYGGAPTYAYTAHTAGTGAALDYVTVVAQTDAMGELKLALQNVTDAAHLDRTPRMRLVDAVDVEASNRASLIFELRGQRSRQFGVYRVIGAQADQTFVTGTTQ